MALGLNLVQDEKRKFADAVQMQSESCAQYRVVQIRNEM